MELEESDGAAGLRLSHSALAELGTPIPRSLFWRLHATMAHLDTR